MPTAPDKKWLDLLDLLGDNDEGAISEEDVRAIARFARTSYAISGASGIDVGNWITALNSPPISTDIPRYSKLMGLTVSGARVYRRGENYLSPTTDGFSYSGTGGGTDTVTASRLVNYQWNVELFSTTLEHCAIGWWYVPGPSPAFPTNAKRLRLGRLYTQTSWTGTSPAAIDQTFKRTSTGYITLSNGTGLFPLNPGDLLVPLLEHYGPSGGVTGAKLSFNLSVHTVGVVDEWTGIPSTYYDTVSDLDVDKMGTGTPFTHTPPSPRLYGQPT